MSKVNARTAIFEGQSAIIKARITDDAGTMVSSDGLSSTTAATGATIKVFDQRTTPATALNGVTAITAISTPAITDLFTAGGTGYLTTGWRLDSTGYNFLVVIPDGDGSAFTVPWEGGHTYIVEITVTTAATISPGTQDEGPISFRVEVKVDSMLGTT